MLSVIEDKSNVLKVRVGGKLTPEDYNFFLPEVERLIEQFGKIRVLFVMEQFEGWTMGALWEDIKFDAKHFADIERLAFVGETKWQKGMSVFCKPFTTAKIRYFDKSQRDQAEEWLREE
jgi:hypothetical protein